ncbi:ankyrin repeat domain-containing protein [Nannocystis sp. RBIL2]|uniref:ankyrin repeat domain-containing protein n=1 Tax=Nannocystis sp. RBIL2 TaxID=2996788 RepID=UPI002270268A|nr:ankyrin repeat domain-containing protein [Nannocystis sp. RBIL2]MCY1065472.1 ankyrin repeat domain-containing protein [Nannocystis sp. RBIL2]
MYRTAPRWERRAAIDRVAALVGVGNSGQDWDFEHADRNRIEIFLAAYEREALDVDERLALMKLIVASLDYALRGGDAPPALARIRAHLVRDYAIHFHTLETWASLDAALEDAYAVTPMARSVFFECTPPLLLAALADDLAGLEVALAAAPAQAVLDDALLGAATSASPAVLERLLAAGASVHTRDESGATPLLRATGGPAALRVLLAAGADIDATESSGWSSLHVATMNGALASVRTLLDLGARLELRDDNGYDALMMASEHGRLELVELLLTHGARVAATSRRGEDALAIARRHAKQAPLDSAAARVRLRLYKAVHRSGGA